MSNYTHETVGTGRAWVEENGEVVEIRAGDPRYDKIADLCARAMANSMVEVKP